MAAVTKTVRARGWHLFNRVAPTVATSLSDLPKLRSHITELDRARDAQRATQEQSGERLDRQRGEISALRTRVAELEGEVQESRRLQQRVAELTDIIAEVLIPLGDRDDDKIKHALDVYARTSF